MFLSFSVSFVLLKYLRKVFICLWCLVGVLSCKDFQSFESIYGCEVQVRFEPEKDEWISGVVKDLQSHKLSEESFIKLSTVTANTANDASIFLKDGLSIPLDPNANEVSFALVSQDGIYCHKVIICYERQVSLISHRAGGLQLKYTITEIQLITNNNQRPIFKKFKIEYPVPLKKEKDKTHVTLFY